MDQLESPVAPISYDPNASEDADVDEGQHAWPGVEIWRAPDERPLKTQLGRWLTKFVPFRRTRERLSVVRTVDKTITALVIDPALLMEGGHNYSALLRVKAELSNLNVEHTCVASMTANPVVRKLAAPLLPTKGLWWRSSYTRSEFRKHVRAMRNQLSVVLNDQRRPPDLLILSCCDSVQICAVAKYYSQPSRIPRPHLILWLLFRPNHFRSITDTSAAAQIDEYREAFASVRRAFGDDGKITVLCETEALAKTYRDIIGLKVSVAPCPNLAGVNGKNLRKKRAGNKKLQRKRARASRIVTFGHINEAKGYHFLPEAIGHVLSAENRATFFIHGTSENSDTAVSAAVFDALSKMGPAVVSSSDVLSAPEYQSRLLEADILLLPYDSEVYESRGSGLFNEAREIGIPIVATRDCAFAQPAFDEGWGVEIVERSGPGIAQAILTALQRLPDLSARAEEAAANYSTNNIGTVLRKVVNDIKFDERSVRANAVKRITKTAFLPNSFFGNLYLHDGTSVRGEPSLGVASPGSPQHSVRLSTIRPIMGRVIDTPPVPYCYSVSIDTRARTARKLPSGSHVTAEIFIQVIAGKVSVAWVDDDHQILDGAERYAPAMAGVQHLVIPVPADRVYRLVIRNFSTDSVPTSFCILNLRAKKWSPN